MAFTFDGAGSDDNGASLAGGGATGTNGDGGSAGDAFGGVSLHGAGNSDGGTSGDPRGDTDAFGNRFDEFIHSGRDKFNADGSYRKKRGRRAGSGQSTSAGKRKEKPDLSASLDALSNTLFIVHAGIASVTKIKELEVTKQESDALASSLANVLAEFDVAPDPKVQAIVGLVVTAGTIYGPRLYLYNERMKSEKKKPAELVSIDGTVIA